MNLVARPCQSHIEKSTRFSLAFGSPCIPRRQSPLLHANQDHDVKFQPFCAVERNKAHVVRRPGLTAKPRDGKLGELTRVTSHSCEICHRRSFIAKTWLALEQVS